MTSTSNISCYACIFSEDDCAPEEDCTIINYVTLTMWLFGCLIVLIKAPLCIISAVRPKELLPQNRKIYLKKKQLFFILASIVCILGVFKAISIIYPPFFYGAEAFFIIDFIDHLFTVFVLSLYISIAIAWIEILDSHVTLGLSELRYGYKFIFLFILVGILVSVGSFIGLLYFPNTYLQIYYAFMITDTVTYAFLLILFLLYGARLFNTLNDVAYNPTYKDRIENTRKSIRNLLRKVSFYVILTSITLLTITTSFIIPIFINHYLEKQVFLVVLYQATVFTYCLLVFFGLTSFRACKGHSSADSVADLSGNRSSYDSDFGTTYGTQTFQSTYDSVIELADESKAGNVNVNVNVVVEDIVQPNENAKNE